MGKVCCLQLLCFGDVVISQFLAFVLTTENGVKTYLYHSINNVIILLAFFHKVVCYMWLKVHTVLRFRVEADSVCAEC